MKPIIVPAALALTACTYLPDKGGPQPKPPTAICDAGQVQYAVGKAYTDSLGNTLKKQSGAAVLRSIPPGGMVTMDLREDRLNINYDQRRIITKIGCG